MPKYGLLFKLSTMLVSHKYLSLQIVTVGHDDRVFAMRRYRQHTLDATTKMLDDMFSYFLDRNLPKLAIRILAWSSIRLKVWASHG